MPEGLPASFEPREKQALGGKATIHGESVFEEDAKEAHG